MSSLPPPLFIGTRVSETTAASRHRPLRLPWLFFWIGLVAAVASLGAAFPPDAWYAALRKPTFNPPAWIFAPVWTTLYLMMAVAAWMVMREPAVSARVRRIALVLMAMQLALNALWTPLFFGLHAPGLAFLDICALWAAVLATIFAFAAVRPLASWLLAPYIVWVSFALVLNGSIWLMNR